MTRKDSNDFSHIDRIQLRHGLRHRSQWKAITVGRGRVPRQYLMDRLW